MLGPLRALARGLQRTPRAGAAVLCVGWAALIWSLSSRSPVEIVERSPWASVMTNLAHAPEFGLFTLWLILAVPRRGGFPVLQGRTALAIVGIVMAYAVIDEIHQSFTPGRDASVLDLMTDLSGTWLTLRLATEITDPRTTHRDVARTLAFGLWACILCAILASFVPAAWPQYGWL